MRISQSPGAGASGSRSRAPRGLRLARAASRIVGRARRSIARRRRCGSC